MANRRVLVKRRKAVRNIRKITRTMQLIATARFQASLNRATATKPYTQKMAELVRDLSTVARDVRHPLMATHEEAKCAALVVLTSGRGLCGGYNAHVLRSAIGHIEEATQSGVKTDVQMVGRKGISYFRFLRRPMTEAITHIDDPPRFDQVQPIADGLMDRFRKGEISSVHVAYMKFHSVGRQRSTVLQLLPFAHRNADHSADASQSKSVEYEFSPDPKALLDELLPAAVRVELFQCFNDAILSEHIARMVAMKAATDAAEDMITHLSRKYNRARQTQITMELLDIVGGANALS